LREFLGAVLAVGTLTVGMAVVVDRAAGARPQQEARAGGAAQVAPPRSGVDDPSRKQNGRAGEIIVRAADLSHDRGEEGFIGMAAIDPETAKWRAISKGRTLGPGPVSP